MENRKKERKKINTESSKKKYLQTWKNTTFNINILLHQYL